MKTQGRKSNGNDAEVGSSQMRGSCRRMSYCRSTSTTLTKEAEIEK